MSDLPKTGVVFDERLSLVDDVRCVPSEESGRDMRDCCSVKSELTCDVLSGLNFMLFILSALLFLHNLLKREAL